MSEHQRRIILTRKQWYDDRDNFHGDEYLAYCTRCVWYQQDDLMNVMSKWATHLEELDVDPR